MASDPDLLDAYRKQCRSIGPELTFMAWLGQRGVDRDDLIDIMKQVQDEAQDDHHG